METQTATTNTEQNRQTYPFSLPPLGYEFGALEPFIDAETMELHHDKHHQAYVDNLNDALKDHAICKSFRLKNCWRKLIRCPTR